MLETARRVVHQFPQVHFLIMGYPNVEKYRAVADELGLSKYTSFPGRIPISRRAIIWLHVISHSVRNRT